MKTRNTKFLSHGIRTNIQPVDRVSDSLEAQNYELLFDPNQGCFFLEDRDPFVIPEKVYGAKDQDPVAQADRVTKIFSAKDKGFGVLLSGEKGTGKTVTAKMISSVANEKLKMPTIIVAQAFDPGTLGTWLEQIEQPCVLMVDEFEKIYYDPKKRSKFLSVLDGLSSGKNLWVFTTNDENIGSYFINRPGRVRYHYRYDNLSEEQITAILNDSGLDKEYTDSILTVTSGLPAVSHDSLSTLIEETKLTGEPASAFFGALNVEPEDVNYEVSVSRREHRFTGKDPVNAAKELGIDIDDQENKHLLSSLVSNVGQFNSLLKHHLKGGKKDAPLWETLAPETVIEYEGSYKKPIIQLSDGRVRVETDLREKGKYTNEVGFYWNTDRIAEISQERGAITVTNIDGSVLRCKPQKKGKKTLAYSVTSPDP